MVKVGDIDLRGLVGGVHFAVLWVAPVRAKVAVLDPVLDLLGADADAVFGEPVAQVCRAHGLAFG